MGAIITCMNKNFPIFTCNMENGMITEIGEVLDEKHLPIILQDAPLDRPHANAWLKSRKIPDNRDGLKMARRDFPKFEMYHHMFSLSDQYWFQYKKTETWEKLNYFTNDFSEEVGRIFFEPWTVDTPRESPDLTTNGVLKKRWIRENGITKLIKAGSKNGGQNPISEVLSSMTLEQMGIIPFVKYSLYIDGLQICCICDNFINENTEFVPFEHIYNKEKRGEQESIYSHTVKMAEKYGIENAKDYIDRMIAADHFICNTDRHLGNFGFIRDVETGKLEFAPLFDCGSAFFTPSTENKIFPEHEKECVKRFKKELIQKGMNKEGLIKLVREYPAIEKKEEKFIIRNINRIYGEVADKKDVLKEKSNEDLLFE